MTDDRQKKETEEKSDSEKVDDALAKGFAKLAKITPMAPDLPPSEFITTLPPEQDARFRYPFIDFILNEIDEGVESEDARQAFDFPINDPDTPGTRPSNQLGDSLLNSRVKPDDETTYYVCISW